MDKFEAMRAFVKVVENEGFAAAGRELNLSRSAVSKYVAELERYLATQLLNRSTRHVSPTESGLAFHEKCVAILAALEDAERTVSDLQDRPTGTLNVNAPMSFGTLHLGRALADFMARYPEIKVELVLSDRFVDPVEEGFDVTIRIADLPDSALIAKKLAPAKLVLCASPDYLEKAGIPTHPSELRHHRCLHYGYLSTGNQWRFAGPDGPVGVRIDGVLCSNNGQVLRDGAVRGLGIALMPTFIAGADLQEGRLSTVLTEFRAPDIAIYALYPPNRHLTAKVRLLIDFLGGCFGDPPYWDLVS
jgi:DNA-binding transcriptional LysR family regulator